MTKVRINKQDLKRSAKAMSSAFAIKHTKCLEIIIKGCGFDDHKEYKENIQMHPHTGEVYLHGCRDIEQLTPAELKELETTLTQSLAIAAPNLSFELGKCLPFIENEKRKKLGRYISESGGYRARVFLGLHPYLYSYATGEAIKPSNQTTDEVITDYARSLRERYYSAPDLVHSLVLTSHRMNALPSTRIELAKQQNLFELFAFNQKPLDKTCFETNIIRYIANDIEHNGDGSELEYFVKSELIESDKRNPATSDRSFYASAERLGFEVLPTLGKPRVCKSPTEIDLFTKRLKLELGFERPSYDIKNRPYAGLSSTYPLMLTENNLAPDLLLSRADLLSGLLFRGTTGSGSHELMLIMLSQLMSTNGGFIYLNGNGHLGDFYTLYSHAYAMNRENDMVFISRLTAEHYSVQSIKELIAGNKLVYVNCGAMEKTPDGTSGELILFIKRLMKATNKKRNPRDTPYTIASNNDMLRDPEVKIAMERLDKLCVERRYGRLFNDYGERYYTENFFKERHYMFQALMNCECEEECPYFSERKRFAAGEAIITMDRTLIRDKGMLVYRRASPVQNIILTQ